MTSEFYCCILSLMNNELSNNNSGKIAQQVVEDLEIRREQGAAELGLPLDSTWEQVGAEAIKITILNRQKILKNVQDLGLHDLAPKLEKCFSDCLPLQQHAVAKTENPQAKLAASVFVADYSDLDDYVSILMSPFITKQLGESGETYKGFLQQLLDVAWESYDNYAKFQNGFNNAGYMTDRNEILRRFRNQNK